MRRATVSAFVRLLAEESALIALAASVLLLAPVRTLPPRVPTAGALVAGAGAGVLLFAVLARQLRPPRFCVWLVPASPLLLVRAAAEEAVWRWGLLLSLSPRVGVSGAVGISSTGFAVAHGVHQTPRQLAVRAGIGCVFALVFVATGRLLAAIAAHAVYNTLVVAAAAGAEREPG